jgi:hypothetical protein
MLLPAPSGLLLSRSPFPSSRKIGPCLRRVRGRYPPGLLATSADTPRSLESRCQPSSAHGLARPVRTPMSVHPASLTFSVSPLRASCHPSQGASPAVVFSAARLLWPLDHRSRGRPQPRLTTSSAAQTNQQADCLNSLQGLPLRLHATCSSHPAPPMVFYPPPGFALSQSPLRHRSVTRSPPGHSPRLHGLGSPGCPCV